MKLDRKEILTALETISVAGEGKNMVESGAIQNVITFGDEVVVDVLLSTPALHIKKRAEVLGIITKDTFCFAVAGTHGKTTTSSILGHVLYESGVDVTAFLGGIVENYNSNLIGSGKTVTVVEADEFDRSFLHLHPNVSCVTSMDADHLDIYGDAASIEDSFREFAAKTPSENLYVIKGLPLEGNTIGVNNDADFSAQNIRIENGFYVFDVKTPTEVVQNVKFGLPGHHNLTNALLAFAMAKSYGVSNEKILCEKAGSRWNVLRPVRGGQCVQLPDVRQQVRPRAAHGQCALRRAAGPLVGRGRGLCGLAAAQPAGSGQPDGLPRQHVRRTAVRPCVP